MKVRSTVVIGMLFGAILVAFALYRPSSPASMGVGFLGYTNGAAGARFARFGFTNQSGVTVRRWGHFDREVKKSPSLAYTFNLGSQVLVSPGQAEVILVPLNAAPAFTYQRDWRAVFYWRRENWQTRFKVWLDSSPWLPTSRQGRGVRVQGAPSEWIDE